MGKVSLTGDPPYSMPPIQDVEARAEGTTVELTLSVAAQSRLSSVRLILPVDLAQKLRAQLQAIVPIAERNAKRRRS
jgi:hypothetical protein